MIIVRHAQIGNLPASYSKRCEAVLAEGAARDDASHTCYSLGSRHICQQCVKPRGRRDGRREKRFMIDHVWRQGQLQVVWLRHTAGGLGFREVRTVGRSRKSKASTSTCSAATPPPAWHCCFECFAHHGRFVMSMGNAKVCGRKCACDGTSKTRGSVRWRYQNVRWRLRGLRKQQRCAMLPAERTGPRQPGPPAVAGSSVAAPPPAGWCAGSRAG